MEVSADTALDKSPSDASVRARLALNSSCAFLLSLGGLDWRLLVSEMNDSHSESMSPLSSCLQRETMSGRIRESCCVFNPPRRGGTRRQNLARACLKVHEARDPVFSAHASVTATTSA